MHWRKARRLLVGLVVSTLAVAVVVRLLFGQVGLDWLGTGVFAAQILGRAIYGPARWVIERRRRRNPLAMARDRERRRWEREQHRIARARADRRYASLVGGSRSAAKPPKMGRTPHEAPPTRT
jgi:hypothetical protein